ncbi:MAG: hypothetical protein EOO12_00185 [Chitinophagaceae bacterium]|nr:MAG: hypothetical protein EOO12_00185 [Chitinophagaceae bacterium]
MSAIPDDVMKAAEQAFREALRQPWESREPIEIIARAILADRQQRWRYDPLRPDPARDLPRPSFGPDMSDAERSEMLSRGQTVTG